MIDRALLLSELLENYVCGEDEGFVEMYPDEGRRMLELDKFIGESLRIAREEFSDDFVPAVEELARSNPEMVAYSLDSLYIRELLKAVPGLVERTLKLTGLSTDNPPSRIVNEYLREAVRAYIFGFPQASIALTRAVLEQAVKECAKDKPGDVGLRSWIEQVAEERAMDRDVVAFAHNVARKGNGVLHSKPGSLADAFDILVQTRKFLTELYAAKTSRDEL